MSSHSVGNSSPMEVSDIDGRRTEDSTPESGAPDTNAATLFSPSLTTRYVPPPGSPFAHRWSFEGRARINNAAETPHFCKHRALVYHFLDMYNVDADGDGDLKSCTLRCGVCEKGTWRWKKNGKSKGSTTNMNYHMSEKHHSIWQAGVQSDRAAWSVPPVTKPVPTTSPTFDIDEFHTRLTRWFNEEFRDLLLYLSPELDGRLISSNGIRERTEAMISSTKQSASHSLANHAVIED
ncbi:hypothetical protein B0J17DRAFT_677854 [Rhizoctonia solani]|nr:hypothetical protein B0J17DRAFT_677854 [Rhizoctonia solani]